MLVVSEYAPGDTVLERLEKEAQQAKKGLWTDPKPVPPCEWQKRNRHHDLLFITTGQLEKVGGARPNNILIDSAHAVDLLSSIMTEGARTQSTHSDKGNTI